MKFNENILLQRALYFIITHNVILIYVQTFAQVSNKIIILHCTRFFRTQTTQPNDHEPLTTNNDKAGESTRRHNIFSHGQYKKNLKKA